MSTAQPKRWRIGIWALFACMASGINQAHADTQSSMKNEPIPATNPLKNIVLIGAAGRTSQEIIPRVLEQDDVRLTLFLRRAQRLQHLQSERVKVVEGDATRLADLKAAIDGNGLVISTLGGMDLETTTANIVQAMQETGAQHLVMISAGGIYDELPTAFNLWDKMMVGRYRPINRKAADIAEQSGLNYTVLRPVWLTNKPIETFELTQKGETFKGTETSRASLARLIADLIKNPTSYINQNLGISQTQTEGNRPAAYR